MGANFFLYYFTILSCIGGFLFGYDTGVISGALILISDEFDLTNTQKELVVSMTVAGALVGAIFAGSFSDSFGRKMVVMVSSLLFVAGSIVLSVFAFGYTWLLVGRFVVGLGVGTASMIMPTYVCEASPAEIRGTMVTYIEVSIAFGQFASSCVDGAFSLMKDSELAWRFMLGLAAVPAALQFFGFMSLPESPRWLLEMGREEDAMKALLLLRSPGYGFLTGNIIKLENRFSETLTDDYINSAMPPEQAAIVISVRDEMHDILEAIDLQRRDLAEKLGMKRGSINSADNMTIGTPTLGTVCRAMGQKTVLRALFVGCMLQACQQFAGINTIMYYSATILKVAGFTSNVEAIMLTIAITFINFVAAFSGLYFVDRVGRRVLTMGSLIAVSFALAITAVAFYFAEKQTYASDINAGGECGGYSYCLDCVSQAACGFCDSIVNIADGSVVGRGCLHTGNFMGNATHSYVSTEGFGSSAYTCSSSANLNDETCEGTGIFGWLIFACMCLYLIAFQPGLGPMPWCINSEIFPTSVRGTANSITTATNWAGNFVMSVTFLSLAQTLSNQGAYALYTGIAILFVVFFYFFLPEAKDVPLEHVEKLFEDDVWGRAWRTSRMRFDTGSSNSLSDPTGVRNALLQEDRFFEAGNGASYYSR